LSIAYGSKVAPKLTFILLSNKRVPPVTDRANARVVTPSVSFKL
jgi:hypothetical protein